MALLTKPVKLGLIVFFTLLFEYIITTEIENLVRLNPQHTLLYRLSYIPIPLLATIISAIMYYEESK